MTVAIVTAPQGRPFTHIARDTITGEVHATVYPENDEARGTAHYVEMNAIGRSVRNLEDAKTFVNMNLSGEWDAVKRGDKPGPFNY